MDEEHQEDDTYIPQVEDNSKPYVGQEFSTIENAFAFYNQYARESGFSTKIRNSRKDKETNEVVWREFSCNKEGKTNEIYQKRIKNSKLRTGERNRGQVRVGCKAKMTIVKQQDGPNWIVSKFLESHNHGLTTPSKVHLLRSHWKVSDTKKVLFEQFSQVNMSTSQKMRLMEIDYGGPSNVGCTERDIRNYEQSQKELQKGHDAETLILSFKSEKKKNAEFFYAYEVDENNKFIRCFWSDAVSRRYYIFFGDVIVFDTTYNTNKYGMIFAPFTGVNHHGQTIILGCGFLSDEKTESFVWLFSKLMEAVTKGPPGIIITDQDPAMTKAIAQGFPQTFHRYCIWHILNKFSEKINPITYRDHYPRIKNVIFYPESPEEFELKWNEMVKDTKLDDNEWLHNMYNLRQRWVPAYVRHIFSAGISSSQRAESAHSFFKKYVSCHNSLMDFITRFNCALRNQRHNELKADHVDINERPKCKSLWPLESQMSNVYTKEKFLRFQDEIGESIAYCINLETSCEENEVYNVRRVDRSNGSRHRRLTYDKLVDKISCSCKMYEFEGIPCRHMLQYFRVKQIFELSDKYIMHRWTKNAKIGVLIDKNDGCITETEDVALIARHGKLSSIASLLVDDASLTNTSTALVLKALEDLHIKVREINSGQEVNSQRLEKQFDEDHLSIIDPSKVRAKGCGKRLQSSKEKNILKKRMCRGCGLRGQSHDKRNCPNLDRSTMNDDQSDFGDFNDDTNDYTSA